MSAKTSSKSPFTYFEIHKVNSTIKRRHSDSPVSSILKTPTAIFVTTRSSSAKRLKFANGPVDLQSLKNSSDECSGSVDSALGTPDSYKSNGNGEIVTEENTVEVAVSPVKTMQVSPDSWKAFLEYKKYKDYANETEKTDYTYSRLSKFRHKEIIPGFLIRPNLSRTSLSSFRKNSLSGSSEQSSLNESNLLYEFKVDGSPYGNFKWDFKTPNSGEKSSWSKHYLWSKEGADFGESQSQRDYFSDSGPEEIIKKTYQYTTGSPALRRSPHSSSYHLIKARSLNLDDSDVDEVDKNAANNESNEWLETTWKLNRWGKGGRELEGDGAFGSAVGKRCSHFIGNFFAAMVAYMAAFGKKSRDLFSRHILRRKDDYLYGEDLGYLSGSGYGSPWASGKSYASPHYYSSVLHYGSQGSWYQKFTSYLYDKFSKVSNLITGGGSTYKSYSPYGSLARGGQTARKWRIWWFLIPLLILAGFGLLKTNEKYGIISNQYKAINFKVGELIAGVEDAIKPAWRTMYLSYKRAEAKTSCYINDSWERLKLPFAHLDEWAASKLGTVPGLLVGLASSTWGTLCQGLWTIFNLAKDACQFLLEFFGDVVTAIINLMAYGWRFLRDAYLTAGDSLLRMSDNFLRISKDATLSLGSYLYLMLFGVGKGSSIKRSEAATGGEICRGQMEMDRLASEMADFKSIAWDLSDVKKRIDALELEFRNELETARAKNFIYDKKLEENHLTLQKYQATVNNALMSAKRPGPVSNSNIQYFLDNHSEDLKQWIIQNFMNKADVPPILNENQIASLVAKYYHESGGGGGGGDVSTAYVKKLIGDAIKLYDADKTGRVDYALESAGGQVLSIRCTETYMASPKSYVMLGWAVYTKTSSPRDAITPGMAAGQCWAFVGSQGFLVLQLSHTIHVTGFTMEHISKSLVPRGHIESAPKSFSMWGLKSENDVEPYLFGEYTYLDNDETLQYFPVQHPTSSQYNIVELKISSNHGNPNYTCLYRVRVHGDLNPTES